MTAKELHQLALSRSTQMKRETRYGQGLTLIRFRRWLDKLVQAGLLEKHDRRYYLTDDGWWVATSLGGPLSAHGRIAT